MFSDSCVRLSHSIGTQPCPCKYQFYLTVINIVYARGQKSSQILNDARQLSFNFLCHLQSKAAHSANFVRWRLSVHQTVLLSYPQIVFTFYINALHATCILWAFYLHSGLPLGLRLFLECPASYCAFASLYDDRCCGLTLSSVIDQQ